MDEKLIIKKIMHEIGLDINHENYIIDQDNNNLLIFRGKRLKYSFNNHVKIDKNTEIYFNPLNNIHLINDLFSYYLSKLELMEQIYFPVFFSIRDGEKFALIVKNYEKTIQTRSYYNLILAYIEMIFKLKDGDFNLTELDSKIR